jgi:hypothetical protein
MKKSGAESKIKYKKSEKEINFSNFVITKSENDQTTKDKAMPLKKNGSAHY